jgi:hypothetical protein
MSHLAAAPAAAATAEAPPSLLDALARAPAAAALVVAALEEAEDRKALRLAHSELSDVVDEATTVLIADFEVAAAARPPTPRRWPRLEELTLSDPNLAAFEALGAEPWDRLHMLSIGDWYSAGQHCHMQSPLDVPAVRALAAALRQMPALHALVLWSVALSDAAAGELFGAEGAAPGLRRVAVVNAELTPATARTFAATGWRLEALSLSLNPKLGTAGVAALVAAPTFTLRRLDLSRSELEATALLIVANAPWPLEELHLSFNDFSAAEAAPALAAMTRHARLRKLNVGYCRLSATAFKALVEAACPALTYLNASRAAVALDGPHALGAAAFAGFPALEELDLHGVPLGEAGARLLARRRWARLQRLDLFNCGMSDAGLAALAHGAFPALEWLDLRNSGLSAPPTLEDVRRWAPALKELVDGQMLRDDSDASSDESE